MVANPIWIAGYGGTPTGGASPVWIVGYGGAVAGAAESWIAGYGGTPTGGASPVWIAGYGGTPTGGASPIWIGGYITSGSGAPAHSAQALAYLARTVGGNEGGNATNIANLIDGLVADGVWAKLDALYVLAQQNRTDAMLNLVGTNYPLTLNGSFGADPRLMSFVSYVGFSNFINGFLDTGFNATTAISPNFTQNNASYGVWVYSVVQEAISVMATASLGCTIYTNYPGFYARVNNGTTGNVSTTITKGLFVGDRPAAANVVPYQNGVAGASQAGTANTPDNDDLIIGSGQTTQTLSAAFIGASLGASGQLALYNRLRTYMTAVGVP